MKTRFRKKGVLLHIFLVFVIFFGADIRAVDDVNFIKFRYTQPLEKPDQFGTIDLEKYGQKATLAFETRIMALEHGELTHTTKNGGFRIPVKTFDKIVTAMQALSKKRPLAGRDFVGADGNECEIFYGNLDQIDTLRVYSPQLKTQQRNVVPFYNVCMSLIELADLDPLLFFGKKPSK